MTLKELEKESPLSIQLATSAWQQPYTCNIEMNTYLAEAFAFILYKEIKKPNLGNATTKELLEEIKSRLNNIDEILIDNIDESIKVVLTEKDLNYKTTNYK